MRISRRSGPSREAINNRVELLPQSMAATASVTYVEDPQFGEVHLLGDEPPHRVVRPYEVIGEVGVQTLDAHARAADAAFGLHAFGAHRSAASPLRVLFVGSRERVKVDQRLEPVNTALALEATDRGVEILVHQPKQRGHGRAIAQVRLIFDDHWQSVLATNDDGAPAR